MATLEPLNLRQWIDDNRRTLKPPAWQRLWDDREFQVTMVGGPISGRDFHVNPSEEFYFQLEGDMTLRVVGRDAKMRDIPIKAGEAFLLPANTPHSEQRPLGSVGMVVEHRRPGREGDALRFYCDHCADVVYEEEYEPDEDGLKAQDIRELFWSDATMRTCRSCGHILQPTGAPAVQHFAAATARSARERRAAKAEASRVRPKGGGAAVLTKPRPAPRRAR